MSSNETLTLWNSLANDWNKHIGDFGDANRRINSDPILWKFAGDVSNKRVLDAGCGTGYLSFMLQEKGASVVGIDFSPKMIEIAQTKAISQRDREAIQFSVDSCTQLKTLPNSEFDIVISNYVLMDLKDLNSTMKSINRVLKLNGKAILIFSHPCFSHDSAINNDDGSITYPWSHSYFEQKKHVSPPWGLFDSEFIWFHRPLSDYWKAFKNAGFIVDDFEEPRKVTNKIDKSTSKQKTSRYSTRAYSVAFKLIKQSN